MTVELVSEPHFKLFNKAPELDRLKRLSVLILSLFVIWGFGVYLVPWVTSLPGLKPIFSYIVDYDIDATALYYTEIEQFAEADHMIRHMMTYPVHKIEKKSNSENEQLKSQAIGR